jgi:hypothetical protein
MINPKTQYFMAERMKATVKSFAVDYTPLLTAPDKVVDIILEAAKASDSSSSRHKKPLRRFVK